ncbi:MAG: DUF2934 domain-containing protein [Candidatus Sericytochromatia bacterium]
MLKCHGGDCPLKTDCYRYTQPYVKRDAFGAPPYDPATGSCEYFHSNQPDPDFIRTSAYHLWLSHGKPSGRDLEFWDEAWRKACESTGRAGNS